MKYATIRLEPNRHSSTIHVRNGQLFTDYSPNPLPHRVASDLQESLEALRPYLNPNNRAAGNQRKAATKYARKHRLEIAAKRFAAYYDIPRKDITFDPQTKLLTLTVTPTTKLSAASARELGTKYREYLRCLQMTDL